MAKKKFGCGRPECECSTNIAEQLTFGVGLNFETGFFDEPCEVCARAWEKLHPEDAPCWPPPGFDESDLEPDPKFEDPEEDDSPCLLTDIPEGDPDDDDFDDGNDPVYDEDDDEGAW